MKRLALILLLCSGAASAQEVLFICTAQLPCPGFPLGSVQAGIDQNGWRHFKLTLTQNVTLFQFVGTPPPAQAIVNVIFTQDGIGGRTVTFASNITSPCSITATANATTLCQFEYDGVAGVFIGILGGGLSTLPSVAAGSVLASNGVSTPPSFQTKQVIDARDISGVDCTGATDSSTALNALTVVNGITAKTLSFRGCASVQLTSQWLIKGQEFAEIDLGGALGTGGQIQGGTLIFGCSGTADAVIRIDDSGYMNFHGGTIAAKGASCTTNFVGSIRVTNSQTGGYTSTRNTFQALYLTANVGGASVSNYYGLKLDGSPNQEGFGYHHIFIACQNSTNSFGLWINGQNSDSNDFDDESNITSCYQGVRVDAGVIRVRNSHIGGNGSFATFGAGGANIFEAQIGCVQEAANIIAAENSGAFLTGPSGANGSNCRRTFYNNTISFGNIDPALYPINLGGGVLTLWANDFSNGGTGVTIHNNALVGDDANGLAGPQSKIYDFGGNLINDGGNPSPFLMTFQPFQQSQGFSGPTSQVAVIPGGYTASTTPAAGTSNDFALLPNCGPTSSGNNFNCISSRLVFSRALFNATSPVMDQFAIRNVDDQLASQATLAITYKPATGYTTTGIMSIQPPISGLSISQASTPTVDPYRGITNVGTPGNTTYTYQFVGLGGCGTTPGSALETTNTGAATLNSTNYNRVTFSEPPGAWGVAVYRTVGGATQGKIGIVPVTDSVVNIFYMSILDTGLTGDGTSAPTTNSTGCFNLAEISAPVGSASSDILWADSTAHRLKMNNNNGTPTQIAGFSDSLGVFASGGTITPITVNAQSFNGAADGSFGSSGGINVLPCETSFAVTTLSTSAATTDTGLTCLPPNAIIDAVVYRITQSIGNATSFTVGDASTAARFCSTQSTVTAGTTGVCLVPWTSATAGTMGQIGTAKVRITSNATPTQGQIRLIVYAHTFVAPTS